MKGRMERKAWVEEGAWTFYLSNQNDDDDDIIENSGDRGTFLMKKIISNLE